MKSVVLSVAVLSLFFTVAFGFESPLAPFRSFQGKRINGRELPASFFNVVDSFALPSAAKRQEGQFSAACQAALIRIGQNPICQVQEGQTAPDPALMCEGACRSLFDAAANACSGPNDQEIGKVFSFFTDIICLKDNDGNYCFNELQKLQQFENNNGELTAAQLDIMCSPCFYKILNVLFAHPFFQTNTSSVDAKNINAFFDIACTRADGKWCVLTLKDSFCEQNTTQPGALDTACMYKNLNTLCKDRCFKKILAKYWLFAGPETEEGKQILASLRFACVQDGNEYCLARWAGVVTQFNNTCPDSTWAPQGCNDAACKTAATVGVDTMGCCMQTYIDFAKQGANEQEAAEAAFLETRLETSPCDLTLEAACPVSTATAPAERKFYIRMTWSWAAQNDAQARAALRRDLATFLGVPEDDVVLVTFVKDNDDLEDDEAGVALTWRAKGQTDQETSAFASDFDAVVSQGTLSLPTTAQLYAPQGSLSVADTPTTEEVSAASVATIVSMLYFGALVAVFF